MDVTAVDSHPVRNPDPASDITCPVSDGSPCIYCQFQLPLSVLLAQAKGNSVVRSIGVDTWYILFDNSQHS